MTPKEKAQQLVERYNELGKDFTRGVSMKEFSKQCALIAVEEMKISLFNADLMNMYDYWFEVKKEIKKL